MFPPAIATHMMNIKFCANFLGILFTKKKDIMAREMGVNARTTNNEQPDRRPGNIMSLVAYCCRRRQLAATEKIHVS